MENGLDCGLSPPSFPSRRLLIPNTANEFSHPVLTVDSIRELAGDAQGANANRMLRTQIAYGSSRINSSQSTLPGVVRKLSNAAFTCARYMTEQCQTCHSVDADLPLCTRTAHTASTISSRDASRPSLSMLAGTESGTNKALPVAAAVASIFVVPRR